MLIYASRLYIPRLLVPVSATKARVDLEVLCNLMSEEQSLWNSSANKCRKLQKVNYAVSWVEHSTICVIQKHICTCNLFMCTPISHSLFHGLPTPLMTQHVIYFTKVGLQMSPSKPLEWLQNESAEWRRASIMYTDLISLCIQTQTRCMNWVLLLSSLLWEQWCNLATGVTAIGI